jgi:hypothetical protein
MNMKLIPIAVSPLVLMGVVSLFLILGVVGVFLARARLGETKQHNFGVKRKRQMVRQKGSHQTLKNLPNSSVFLHDLEHGIGHDIRHDLSHVIGTENSHVHGHGF